MATFLDLIVPETLESQRNKFVGYCVGAGLKVTDWATQSVSYQWKESTVAGLTAHSLLLGQITRGFASLDTSVDPGDYDPYDDENINREPVPGFLSEQGENVHGVIRGEATFAQGQVDFINAGPTSRNISPSGLVFSYTNPDGETFSYTNIYESSVYTNPDGTVTVGVGTQVTLTVSCNILGAKGSVPSNELEMTTTLLGCSATNPSPIIGTDRLDADNYRAICRTASGRLSLNGPGSAYEFLARYNLDGTALLRADGVTPVNITRTWVSQESSTGIVTAYFASDAGPAIPDDVLAANTNIEEQACAVGDCITYSGYAAGETTIHVAGTARIKNRPGLTEAQVIAGILANLIEVWPTIPLGGYDRDSLGAGVLYRNDVEAIGKAGYVGLYDVVVTSLGETTAIDAGHVGTLQSETSDWTVTLVP
jgi:hypothetical protein